MPKKKPTIKDLEKQVADLTEALQRERADAENVRRRSGEDIVNAIIRGKEQAVEGLLPLLDTLSLAFAHPPKDIAEHKWVKGVMGLDKQLQSIMQEFGLEKIPTKDQEFDPELMQAVTAEGEGDVQTVSEELQPGYKLNGKVVRVAMVRVENV